MYTKGKWKIGSHNDEPFARSCLSIFREDGRRICEVSREGFMPIEEAEANAHLIAAAPDLYEACKELYETELNADVIRILQPWFQRMERILAKAEGK